MEQKSLDILNNEEISFRDYFLAHKKIILLILFGFFVIILINLTIEPFYFYDYQNYILQTYGYINPYKPHRFYSKYPGLYFLFMQFLGYAGIHTIPGIKMIYGIIDLINVIIIMKLSLKFVPYSVISNKIEKKMEILPIYISVVYIFFPHHVFVNFAGENDVFSLLFLLLAVTFFLENKIYKSSICTGIGIMFKIFPIFFLIPTTIYFLRTKRIKECILYWAIIGAIFIIFSLPYMIIDFYAYLQGIFINASRMTSGFSYAILLPEIHQDAFSISFFDIGISYNFIIQIIIILLFFIAIFIKYNNLNKKEFLIITLFSFMLPAFISYQDLHTSFLRFLPFLIIIFYTYTQQTKIKWIKLKIYLFPVYSSIYLIYFYFQAQNFERDMLYFMLIYYFLIDALIFMRKEKFRIISVFCITLIMLFGGTVENLKYDESFYSYLFQLFIIRMFILWPLLFYCTYKICSQFLEISNYSIKSIEKDIKNLIENPNIEILIILEKIIKVQKIITKNEFDVIIIPILKNSNNQMLKNHFNLE